MVRTAATDAMPAQLGDQDYRVARVLRLHVPSSHRQRRARPLCTECGNPHPCETVRILRGWGPAMKRCTICRQNKPLTEFSRRHRICKSCGDIDRIKNTGSAA